MANFWKALQNKNTTIVGMIAGMIGMIKLFWTDPEAQPFLDKLAVDLPYFIVMAIGFLAKDGKTGSVA